MLTATESPQRQILLIGWPSLLQFLAVQKVQVLISSNAGDTSFRMRKHIVTEDVNLRSYSKLLQLGECFHKGKTRSDSLGSYLAGKKFLEHAIVVRRSAPSAKHSEAVKTGNRNHKKGLTLLNPSFTGWSSVRIFVRFFRLVVAIIFRNDPGVLRSSSESEEGGGWAAIF